MIAKRHIAIVATGGDTMVGPKTAAWIKAHYVLGDAGEHRLKNVSEPVPLFRLVPSSVYRNVLA